MNNEYLNNDKLTFEIILSKGKGFLTQKAFLMLDLLGKNISRKMNFNNYEEQQDIISDGVLQMCLRFNFYDEEKYHNAFPFFTEIFKRACAKSYNCWMNRKNPGLQKFYPKFYDLEKMTF